MVCRRVAVSSFLAAALAAAVPAQAQYVVGGGPLYGTVTGRVGFAPDPMVMDGIGGGPVSLSSFNGSCRGYAQAQPSHVFMAQTGFRFLAIMVNASYDTTLMVRTPDGQVYCNDDTDGLQARVEISTPPGPVQIWVGSYSSTSGGPYRLGLSNSQSVRGAHLGVPGSGVVVAPPGPAGIDPRAAPLYGQATVRSGGRPDPTLLTGGFGGPLEARFVDGSCRGWITAAPSHIVMAQSPFRNLRFVVAAGQDTTLVVQFPDGRIACDDDSGGAANPVVEAGTPPGPIRIWVGSYSSGRTGPYTLGVTEDPRINYAMLGAGSVVVAPPPVVVAPPPPPVVVAPPAATVHLVPRIPVTVFGGGITGATLALWNPRGGPEVQIGVVPDGPGLRVFARVGSNDVAIGSVPAEVARDSVITVTQRPDGRILVRAEQVSAGAVMLMLVQWDPRDGAPEMSQQWVGAMSDRSPRWAR